MSILTPDAGRAECTDRVYSMIVTSWSPRHVAFAVLILYLHPESNAGSWAVYAVSAGNEREAQDRA